MKSPLTAASPPVTLSVVMSAEAAKSCWELIAPVVTVLACNPAATSMTPPVESAVATRFEAEIEA